MKTYDVQSRMWIDAPCCAECARTGGSCGGGRMGAAVLGPDGTTQTSTLPAPQPYANLGPTIILGSIGYGAALGGISGAVAQDKGKRMKGAGWGALAGGAVAGLFAGTMWAVWGPSK